MMGVRLCVLGLCMSLACAVPALAHDEAAGKKKAEETCAGCHGPEGNKPVMPETPRLAGQEYGYLVHSLNAYRSGARDNALMGAMAKPLSEQDVHDIAWYFSRRRGLTTEHQ